MMLTRKTRFISGLAAVMMLISMFTAFVLPVVAEDESEGKDGITAFSTDKYDATYSLTIKKMIGEYVLSTEVSYHQVGEKLTAPEYEGYALNEDAEKTPVTLVDGEFLMPAKNAELVYVATAPNWNFLEDLIGEYQNYVDLGYDQSSECGRDLVTLLVNMKEIYANRANMEDAEALEYIEYFANEAARLEKILFPDLSLLSISQYEDFPNEAIYTIASLSDLERVYKYKGNLNDKQTIRLVADITIPENYTSSAIGNANDLSGLVASIDGKGHTITGLKTENAWLGDYAGAAIKNLTFKDCSVTASVNYSGLLINVYSGTRLEISGVSLINCAAIKGTGSPRISLIVGQGKNITFKNVDIQNCSIDTASPNNGFLVGQANGGAFTIDTVYLNNNKYITDASTSAGLFGEVNAASITIKNVGIFNTKIKSSRYGLLTGRIKGNGSVTVCENIFTAKSVTVSLFGDVSAGTVATPVNLYSDITALVRNGEARENNLAAIESGEAAWTANATGSGQTWAMKKSGNTYIPIFATEGKPVKVTFQRLLSEPVSLYTDSEGKLIGLEREFVDAYTWQDGSTYASLSARRFTEDTVIREFECPHSVDNGTLSYTQNDTDGTHTIKCLIPGGCGLVKTDDACVYEFTLGDGVRHTKICSLCGDTITEDCVLTKTQTYENGTYYHTIICDCGYEKKEQCDFDSVYTVHTQTANGYWRYTCKVCGEHYDVEDTDSKHDVDDLGTGTVVKKPTYPTADSDGKGIARYVCDDCGYILYADVPALNLGDKLGIVVNVPMTTIDGSTIEVTLELANNTGVAGLNLGVTYDADVMELRSVENGMFEYCLKPADLTQVHGYLPLTFANATNLTAAETDGKKLVTLSFEIIEGAEIGYHSISVAPVGHEMNTQNTGAANENGQYIPVAGSSAMIEILDYLWGDANGDGEVNILDAQVIMKYEILLVDETALDMEAANANRTKAGTVDILDALVILRYLAGVGEWDPYGKTFPPYNAA